MRAPTDLHDEVADLLTYPGPVAVAAVRDKITAVAAALPGATEHLEAITKLVDDGAPGELEETFCRTFDNNADRALEVGWQIWGENYDRGAFLVRMREMMRATGVAESTELPDHLSHVLRVLGRLDPEEAHKFVISTVLPAVRKTRDGFKGEENPYLGVVETALLLLGTHVEVQEAIHE